MTESHNPEKKPSKLSEYRFNHQKERHIHQTDEPNGLFIGKILLYVIGKRNITLISKAKKNVLAHNYFRDLNRVDLKSS